MIIATQRPSTDVVTGLIKANFPSRIAFAVASQIDSRVILDSPGAERLLGKGDMLYMASDSPKLARIQGCFVSDPEIHNVVDYWKRARLAVEPEPDLDLEAENEAAAEAKLPWDDLVKEANQDDLLKEAIQLVVETGRASTTFLQRRLGIGYPRASRLMDQLEEEGVVGPAAGANPREVHWHEDNLEA
jgi:S-DNA-T family DNA segregation ATPase FtsK/SpoIIIE